MCHSYALLRDTREPTELSHPPDLQSLSASLTRSCDVERCPTRTMAVDKSTRHSSTSLISFFFTMEAVVDQELFQYYQAYYPDRWQELIKPSLIKRRLESIQNLEGRKRFAVIPWRFNKARCSERIVAISFVSPLLQQDREKVAAITTHTL